MAPMTARARAATMSCTCLQRGAGLHAAQQHVHNLHTQVKTRVSDFITRTFHMTCAHDVKYMTVVDRSRPRITAFVRD